MGRKKKKRLGNGDAIGSQAPLQPNQAQWILTISLTGNGELGSILQRNTSSVLAFPPHTVTFPENLDPNPHTSVPDNAPRLVEKGRSQAPKKGTVFDRSDAKLFIEALEDPDHKYRQRAVQHVRRFNAAVEKEKAQDLINERGILLRQASRKYGIPVSTLRGWEAMGIISPLLRGETTQGVYYDEEVVARAAPVYHESRQQGEQAAGRLKALFAEQDKVSSLPRRQRRRTKKNLIFDEKRAVQKLLTLKEAMETHGIAYETLRSWYRSGHLPLKGREKFGTHGGGKILVAEEDVIRLKTQPPTKGRPPLKPTE
jgi:DNA-binding transcriptional MerR regulator